MTDKQSPDYKEGFAAGLIAGENLTYEDGFADGANDQNERFDALLASVKDMQDLISSYPRDFSGITFGRIRRCLIDAIAAAEKP